MQSQVLSSAHCWYDSTYCKDILNGYLCLYTVYEKHNCVKLSKKLRLLCNCMMATVVFSISRFGRVETFNPKHRSIWFYHLSNWPSSVYNICWNVWMSWGKAQFFSVCWSHKITVGYWFSVKYIVMHCRV